MRMKDAERFWKERGLCMNDEQGRRHKNTADSVGAVDASPLHRGMGRHHRRSIRLEGYDYAQPGAYFITICTQDRVCLFGDIVDGVMRLNQTGEIVRQCWMAIPEHFPHAMLDEFVVMPNHVHGIIVVGEMPNVGATHASPLPLAPPRVRPHGPHRQSVGSIVGSFKSAATRRMNEYRGTSGTTVWQRNYYEHIIRTEDSLDRIRRYIAENPARWAVDRENPFAIAPEPEDTWAL
jgi:putative transposase